MRRRGLRRSGVRKWYGNSCTWFGFCGRGGIGRRAGLRSRWEQSLEGSTPFVRTPLMVRRCDKSKSGISETFRELSNGGGAIRRGGRLIGSKANRPRLIVLRTLHRAIWLYNRRHEHVIHSRLSRPRRSCSSAARWLFASRALRSESAHRFNFRRTHEARARSGD